ncbi:MAG TPA: glycogen/starch/alpha-glucan phosphorylase, partial [Polyangiaceae bacterium]|nr:glycogen/starch/alpha-glucan phosphorylase [Polyangiaceae bacterium]
NFFLFGMTAEEVLAKRRDRAVGRLALEGQPLLAEALELLRGDFFCPDEPGLFKPLVDDLLGFDQYMVLADFASYASVQGEVDAAFRHQDAWAKKAALNIARVGTFSSDRTIREYASEIWKIEPCLIGEVRDPALVPDDEPDPA